MISDRLVVVEPGRIEVERTDLDDNLEPWEVLVETEYSVISAGTEGAGFTGLVRQMPFGDAGQYLQGRVLVELRTFTLGLVDHENLE